MDPGPAATPDLCGLCRSAGAQGRARVPHGVNWSTWWRDDSKAGVPANLAGDDGNVAKPRLTAYTTRAAPHFQVSRAAPEPEEEARAQGSEAPRARALGAGRGRGRGHPRGRGPRRARRGRWSLREAGPRVGRAGSASGRRGRVTRFQIFNRRRSHVGATAPSCSEALRRNRP